MAWHHTIDGCFKFLVAKFPHLKFRVPPQRLGNECVRKRHHVARRKLDQWSAKETVQDKTKLALFVNRKWHTSFPSAAYRNRWAWRTMNAWSTAAILRYFTEFVSWGATTSKWLRINAYCLQQEWSQKNLVFSNIWLLAIIAEATENEYINKRHPHFQRQ